MDLERLFGICTGRKVRQYEESCQGGDGDPSGDASRSAAEFENEWA